MRIRTLVDDVTKELVSRDIEKNIAEAAKEILILKWGHVLLTDFQVWYIAKEVAENVALVKFCNHFGISSSLIFE